MKKNETQHKLVIGHWSLVIGKQRTKVFLSGSSEPRRTPVEGRRTKDKGVPEPVEGQKCRLGGGNETQQQHRTIANPKVVLVSLEPVPNH